MRGHAVRVPCRIDSVVPNHSRAAVTSAHRERYNPALSKMGLGHGLREPCNRFLQYVVNIRVVVHRELHGAMPHQFMQNRRIPLLQLLGNPAAECLPQLVHAQLDASLFRQRPHPIRNPIPR